jgi:hypothetical protein
MPVSRKNQLRKKAKKRNKRKRKIVGARSAETGQFVEKENLDTNPSTTVAVTKEVEEAKEAE